jgi:hypothetical protein
VLRPERIARHQDRLRNFTRLGSDMHAHAPSTPLR